MTRYIIGAGAAGGATDLRRWEGSFGTPREHSGRTMTYT
jgi:hypothetical protein